MSYHAGNGSAGVSSSTYSALRIQLFSPATLCWSNQSSSVRLRSWSASTQVPQ